MSLTNKRLAWGQLPNSKTALYTVPGSLRVTTLTITFVNTDSVARTVNLYLGNGVNSYRVGPQNMSIDPGNLAVFDDVAVLHAGERIEADASVANLIDYVISGQEG